MMTSTSQPVAIPTIETERLMLRPLRHGDIDGLASFYADPVSQFYGGPPAQERHFRSVAARWDLTR